MEPETLINNPELKVSDLCGDAARVGLRLLRKAQAVKGLPRRFLALLPGPPGVGKSAVARAVARVLADDPANLEAVSGTLVDVDMVSRWMQELRIGTLSGGWQVKLIEEIDQVSPRAQTRMLDMIDNLPAQTAIIGTSNKDYEDITERFHTRFQMWEVAAPSIQQIYEFLSVRWPEIGKEHLYQIARTADGNVRVALHELQTWIDLHSNQ